LQTDLFDIYLLIIRYFNMPFWTVIINLFIVLGSITIATSQQVQQTANVIVLYPLNGNMQMDDLSSKFAVDAALEMAKTILPSVTINIEFVDDNCDGTLALRGVLQKYSAYSLTASENLGPDYLDGIIGCTCNQASSYNYTKISLQCVQLTKVTKPVCLTDFTSPLKLKEGAICLKLYGISS